MNLDLGMIERTRQIGKLTGTQSDICPPSDAAVPELESIGIETAIRELYDELSVLNNSLLAKGSMTVSEAARARDLIERIEHVATTSTEHFLKKVSFQRLDNDVVEVTLPSDMTIEDAGKRANALCRVLKIHPTFNDKQRECWQETESDPTTQTVPGRAYRLAFEDRLVGKTIREQELILAQEGRELAPIGALALATMCIHLETKGKEDFLKGHFVRTTARKVNLLFNCMSVDGVGIYKGTALDLDICCAVLVEFPRSKET